MTFSSFFAFTWWVIIIKYNDLTKIKNRKQFKDKIIYWTLSQLFLETCKSIPWRAITGSKRNSSKINAVFIIIKSLKWKLKTKLRLLTRLHYWLYVCSGKTLIPVVKNKRTSLLWELNSTFMSILGEKIILSFEANSFFSLAESPPHDLPITAYK